MEQQMTSIIEGLLYAALAIVKIIKAAHSNL